MLQLRLRKPGWLWTSQISIQRCWRQNPCRRLKVTVCAELTGSGLTTGMAKFTMGVEVQLPNLLLD